MKPDIFISYCSKDESLVKVLTDALRSAGWEVWTDRSIESFWKREIDEHLDSAGVTVVAVTPDAMESAYVTYEWCRTWFRSDRPPYLLHLRESSSGMTSRLLDDIQFHPSRAYLKEHETRVLTPAEITEIVDAISQHVKQYRDYRQAEIILTDSSSNTEAQTKAADILGNADNNMRIFAGQCLISGLRHQLTDRGNGDVQRAVLRALEQLGDTRAIPYVLKLKYHTTDGNVQSTLPGVLDNLLSRVK